MKQPALRTLSHILATSIFMSSTSSWAGVDIAQTPLMVGDPVAPNIRFILDDSMSMAWQFMPGAGDKAVWNSNDWAQSAPAGLPLNGVIKHDIRFRASNVNTQWYNPVITYEPWMKADGSKYPNAALTDAPKDPSPEGKVESGTFNFTDQLKNWPADNLGTTTSTDGYLSWRYSGFYVLKPKNSDSSNQNYIRYEFKYDTSKKTWQAREKTITSDGKDQKTTNLDRFDWSSLGGPMRTINEEIQNYANWFTYYRLRLTMAKGAASRAFSKLSDGYRIGYITINEKNKFDIPVNEQKGAFSGVNKTNWFDKLQKTAYVTTGTPLRAALGSAGEYFSSKSSTGPYGPEESNKQITCRSNFAILTTDGYWNGNSASNAEAKKNNDNTSAINPITGPDGRTYTYIAEHPYKDNQSDTLADIAMYYWKTDLRTDMPNNVPTTAKNPAFWQNMRTFGISIGEKGTLTPDQSTLNKIKKGDQEWPIPGANKQENIDDLWHAAVNSRGEFLVASNPDEFANALTNTLMEIASETKSEASGGVSRSEITSTTGSTAFFSRYTSGQWDGDLFARSIGTDGKQETSELWSSEAKLPAWGSRNIWVNNNGTFEKLEGAVTGLSADIANYLRGDQSKEEDKTGGTLRKRTRLLPAFINSQLTYVGAPEQTNFYDSKTFAGADSYKNYASTQASRTPMVYISGNNGMLHAFDATTGVEKFAFLTKSAIDSGVLSDYVKPKYGAPGGPEHKYILDGELSVADVYLGSAWITVLVGTQGRGGNGVFALDITNPSNITLLWEKTAADSGALGNNLGKPIITQVAAGDWRVILGNGPNSTEDKAQLIMISLSTGAISVVDTGADGNNGLAGPALWDDDKDGIFETAYAGDLNGNLWRFNNLGGSATATKIFSAPSGQAITSTPLIVRNQKTDDTWIFVGTGRYLNSADLKDETQQAWYGLIDKEDGVVTDINGLLQRTVTNNAVVSGSEGEILNSTAGKNRGWYINFRSDKKGERMMTPNFIVGGALFGITFIPDSSDPCEPKGSSALWAINPFSGANLGQNVFGTVGISILDGLSPVTSGAPPINIDGKKGKFHIQTPEGTTSGTIPTGRPSRQSWREVIAP